MSLGIITVYFLLSSWLIPPGVNNVFTTKVSKYLIPLSIFIYGASILINRSMKVKASLIKPSSIILSSLDILLILLPLTPITQYIASNKSILSSTESVLVFVFFALLLLLPIVIVPFLLKNLTSVHLVMSIGLAFAFSILNMASLSAQNSWHEVGSLRTQLTVFGGVWIGTWIFLELNTKKLLHYLIVFLFIVNSVPPFFVQDNTLPTIKINATNNKLIASIESRKPVTTPNIYLLIYDAYVINETMMFYGINNKPQEQYLNDQGFKIYPHTYSVAGTSLTTMSRVLNSSTSFYGSQWRAASGDGTVQYLLNHYDYKTYGIFPSDFFFRGAEPSYDYSFPNRSSTVSLLTEAIIIGEFQFDFEFDRVSREQFIQEKNRIFSNFVDSPKFIYSHSNLPGHSQNSGACMSNEVDEYSNRLENANHEMRQDIELIIKNDPNALVIVAGDHGPYLTKNCTVLGESYDTSNITRQDVQDRIGTFLAIRWPSPDFDKYDDITVLQDLFPSIFAYIFTDHTLLESKIDPVSSADNILGGIIVIDGIINGGADNKEALFIE